MMWKNYELDGIVLELGEDLTLCRSDKVLVNSNKGTMVVPVKHKDRREGLVFLGHGRLIVDTIVETEKGAIGKPIDREICEPFLMLGDIEETLQHLREAGKEDLARNGVKVEDLFDKAQNLIEKFSGRRAIHGCGCNNEGIRLVFAFATEKDRLDILMLNGSRLVFNSGNLSFVSNGNHSILNKGGQVVLATDRRSIFVERPCHNHGC